MFYDLNIALPESAGKANGSMSSQEWAQVVRAVEQARDLGYGMVALNQTVQGRLTAEHLAVWKTVPAIDGAQLSWNPATGKRVVGQGGSGSGSVAAVKRGSVRVLRRVTAVIREADQGHSVSGTPVSNEYDVVAVRPTSEKLLFAASSGAWGGVDMVALDMAARWGFFAKHKTVGQALALGLAFEVAYGGALGDSAQRQQWVSNVAAMVRVTRGKGLVWASGARQAFELRSPNDVTVLGEAVQLNAALAKRAVSANARAVVVHSFTRTQTLRAVVAEVDQPGSDQARSDQARSDQAAAAGSDQGGEAARKRQRVA
ncbi:RNA-binding RNA processing protein rpp1 [Coemansia erecta]|uniref:RNA-binding RNA processing protein rpp1 n=1 Tax=Coemansia erecta TaxID=147472 RepID=A0A9W7XV06_9FUNG|nr:RNA-binding RNA processing protein rpp1 [Coemansia erecta]